MYLNIKNVYNIPLRTGGTLSSETGLTSICSAGKSSRATRLDLLVDAFWDLSSADFSFSRLIETC